MSRKTGLLRDLPENKNDDTWAHRVFRARLEMSPSEDELLTIPEFGRLMNLADSTVQSWETGRYGKPMRLGVAVFNSYLEKNGLKHLQWVDK